MKLCLKRIWQTEHYWKILVALALIALATLWKSPNIGHLLILMVNAYAMIAFSAMLNRSSTRNSWAYHGIILLVSSFASYWVFRNIHELISAAGLTHLIVIAYITATVWGNFTGSKASIFIERKLGIKTRSKSKDEPFSLGEKRVRCALLIVLGILGTAILIVTRTDYVAAISVLGLNFLNVGIHTFVRRSRNVGDTLFHNIGLLLQGLTFFLLFRFLTQEDMSWVFFLPFAMGGILGGLFVHQFAMWAEKRKGADPDKHLTAVKKKTNSRFPIDRSFSLWKLIISLAVIAGIAIFLNDFSGLVAIIVGLAVAQYAAFTLVSRARTRNSRTYEVYTSMGSNGTWLALFGKLDTYGWGAELFLPHLIGAMIGGNLGVVLAQHIERKHKIRSD